MIQRLYLVVKEIAGSRSISALVLLSVVLSAFTVGLFRIIGDNLENYVRHRFASSIPPNTIKVSMPQPASLFLFELAAPERQGIDDGVLRKIRSMGGVNDIYPVTALKVPLQAQVRYLGFSYRSDILAFGVPYPMVGREIREDRYRRLWKDQERGAVIPVVVPRNILHSYNDGMAAPNGLPRVSEKGAVGFGFRLVLGKSSLKSLPGFVVSDAVIAGFTDQVDSLALIVPLKLAIDFNKKYNQGYRSEYQYAYVKVKDHASLIRVSSMIRKMGFVVEAEKTVSRQIMKLSEAVSLIVGSLQLIIIIIAAIAIAFATAIATLNRIEYYRTLRVIGCSRLFLTFMIIVKYALLGLIGAAAGMELLMLASQQLAMYFNLTGIVMSSAVPQEDFRSAMLYGALIPVLSTIPAIIRLHFKGLSRD
jgi:hypothetical protein